MREIHSSVRKNSGSKCASFSEIFVLSTEAAFKGESDEGVRELIGAYSPVEYAVRRRFCGCPLCQLVVTTTLIKVRTISFTNWDQDEPRGPQLNTQFSFSQSLCGLWQRMLLSGIKCGMFSLSLARCRNPWKPSELALDGMFLKTSIAVPVPGEEPRAKVLVVRCTRYFGLTALLSGI